MEEIKMSDFSWKIWGKKLAKQVIVVVIAGVAAVYGNNALYLTIAPALMALENYIKHK